MIDDGIVTPLAPHAAAITLQLVVPNSDVHYWYNYDLEYMARCDAVLRVPGESFGADQEVAKAREWGLPVFQNVDDLYWWAKGGLV